MKKAYVAEAFTDAELFSVPVRVALGALLVPLQGVLLRVADLCLEVGDETLLPPYGQSSSSIPLRPGYRR